MNQTLSTNTFFGSVPPSPPPPPAATAPSITMPEPISYEVHVVEYVDDNNKIVKVALQYKRNTHDQYGNVKIYGTWEDVPRVQYKNGTTQI